MACFWGKKRHLSYLGSTNPNSYWIHLMRGKFPYFKCLNPVFSSYHIQFTSSIWRGFLLSNTDDFHPKPLFMRRCPFIRSLLLSPFPFNLFFFSFQINSLTVAFVVWSPERGHKSKDIVPDSVVALFRTADWTTQYFTPKCVADSPQWISKIIKWKNKKENFQSRCCHNSATLISTDRTSHRQSVRVILCVWQ